MAGSLAMRAAVCSFGSATCEYKKKEKKEPLDIRILADYARVMARQCTAIKTHARCCAGWRAAIEQWLAARDQFKGCEWPDGKDYGDFRAPCLCTGCAPLRKLMGETDEGAPHET